VPIDSNWYWRSSFTISVAKTKS